MWGEPRPATYDRDELEFIRGFIRQYERGVIGIRELVSQVTILHDTKATFGATILPDRKLSLNQ